VPWLITTPGWPALAQRLAVVTAHMGAGVAVAAGAALGVAACAGVRIVVHRARGHPGAADRTT
jgi:hypothetical protein